MSAPQSALPTATTLHRAGTWSGPAESCALTYEARFFRRRKLTVAAGWSFVAAFERAVSLAHGDALALSDGRLVEVQAAPEALLTVTGDLARIAWHVGNRHAPCQVEPTRLLVQDEPVMGRMLTQLGAIVTPITAPFTPEGGAYGQGRALGHSHDHDLETGHSHHNHRGAKARHGP